jgi:hypothetical protein
LRYKDTDRGVCGLQLQLPFVVGDVMLPTSALIAALMGSGSIAHAAMNRASSGRKYSLRLGHYARRCRFSQSAYWNWVCVAVSSDFWFSLSCFESRPGNSSNPWNSQGLRHSCSSSSHQNSVSPNNSPTYFSLQLFHPYSANRPMKKVVETAIRNCYPTLESIRNDAPMVKKARRCGWTAQKSNWRDAVLMG